GRTTREHRTVTASTSMMMLTDRTRQASTPCQRYFGGRVSAAVVESGSSEQRLDVLFQGRFVTCMKTFVNELHEARAIHDEAGRHRPGFVYTCGNLPLIPHQGELHAGLGAKLLDAAGVVVNAHAEHGELAAELVDQALVGRKRVATRRAPRRPEVDDQH